MDARYLVKAIGAPDAEFVAVLPPTGKMVLRAFQGGNTGHLHEGRHEAGRLFLYLQQGFQQLRLGHDAAQPPAGHGVGLGKGIAGQGPVGHALQVRDG